jgi:hypothetical protein
MMDVKLPAVYCIICENFGERDGKTFTEESLTSLTVHIQTYKYKKAPSIYITYSTSFMKHDPVRYQISRCWHATYSFY